MGSVHIMPSNIYSVQEALVKLTWFFFFAVGVIKLPPLVFLDLCRVAIH